MGDGGGGKAKQVQEVTGDLHPGYLEVFFQPVKLSLYQVAAIVEVEIHLRGEGDDVCRAHIPAEGSKGRGQRWGLAASPILQGREASPLATPSPAYLYHRPSVFPGMLKRAL